MDTKQSLFSQRLNMDYPWVVWFLGWMALLKGSAWLATDPNLMDWQLKILGYKYVACAVPLIVCGFGVWNMKKWAGWGLLLLCLAELIFFVFCPFVSESLSLNKTSLVSLVLSLGTFIINGPISTIMILACSPFFFKKLSEAVADTG